MPDAVMTAEELSEFLAAEFPQAMHPDSGLTIEAVWYKGCRVRQNYQERLIRPAELAAAQGVWLTSSARGPAEVRELDGVPMGPSAETPR